MWWGHFEIGKPCITPDEHTGTWHGIGELIIEWLDFKSAVLMPVHLPSVNTK